MLRFSRDTQVGANAGIVGMTKEHLGLALALNVPVFVVVTKVNMFHLFTILLSIFATERFEFSG